MNMQKLGKKNFLEAVISIAIAMAFVTPVAAFANVGTIGVTSDSENTDDIENMVKSTNSDDNTVTTLPILGTIEVDDDAAPVWYDATHVKTIQEGIDNATGGDTVYVYNGTYYENVLVNKTVDLIGESTAGVVVDGGGSTSHVIDVSTVSVSGVSITNFSVTNGKFGLSVGSYFVPVDHCTITNCDVYGNADAGMSLYKAEYSTVTNCNVYNNADEGVYISMSDNSIITNCVAHDNVDDGFSISSCPPTTITDCISYNSGDYGFMISSASSTVANLTAYDNYDDGIYLSSAHYSTITDCTSYNNNDYGIALYSFVPGCTMTNCDAYDNNDDGFLIGSSCYGTFTDLNSYNNSGTGLYVKGSNNPAESSVFSDCNVYDNYDDGVYLYKRMNTEFINCDIYNNGAGRDSYAGMWIEYCYGGNIIRNCDIHDISGFFGVYIYKNCQYNLITDCNIYNNYQGIGLYTASVSWPVTGNNITYCKVYDNFARGIKIDGSSVDNNMIHHNCFMNTAGNAYDSCSNMWDDGIGEGNYWSDYSGDTLYDIPGGSNKDNYPLMFCPLGDTNVRFDPPSQIVEKGETFTASYYIEPTDWIMGANFVTISFDPTLLEVNTPVTEGTFFGGSAMMFEGGTINNTAGTIKDGYALVLPGNAVYDPGSLFVITFTAKNKLGTSALTMSGVSVKNDTGVNIPVTVQSGSVKVDDFFDLTMSVDGSGTTTPAPGGPYTYVNGTVVPIEAFPDLGWSFDHWTGGVANPSSAITTVTMDANKTVTAYFTEDCYNLTIIIVGNGTVDVDPDKVCYLYGEEPELTAVADPGWTFDSWSGHLAGSVNPETIFMDGDKTVTATFTEDWYTLTIVIIGNGHVDVVPAGPYRYNDIVTLTPVADPDWAFVGWSGPDFAEIVSNQITMTKDMNITAEFKEEWIPMMTISGDIELPTFSTIHMADYVYFGESVSASDGIDGYDLPYPGTPPAPYVAGWFMTDFVDPYDELEKDIRFYPEVAPNDKIWDLWVETDTADTVETVDITLSWDETILQSNEYDYVILRDYLSGVTLVDMRVHSWFVFTADHGMGYHFEIVCGWNHCPVAVDDEYDAVQDMILTVAAPGVKDNDYDDEGNPFDAVNPSDPPHGTLNSFNTDGSFEYEPDPGYYGMDSFTYEVTDGASCFDEATVTITVLRACHIDVNIGWNLISIPASEENFDKTNFFVEFPVGSDVYYSWADAITNGYILDFIYGWTGGASGVYFDEAYLDPGEGYWLWAYEDCTLIMYSDAPEDNHITTFDDGEGWYLVGAPYMYNLAKWNTWIHYAALDYTWTQASNPTNNIILEYLYDWNRATQNYDVSENPDFFESGRGYWMYVYKQCSLKKA